MNSNPTMYLRNCTRLDPMTYLLFGAYRLQVTEKGLDCDGWLPVMGNIDTLDDVQRLKTLMETCMLRVFEGIVHWKRSQAREVITAPNDNAEEESGDEDTKDEVARPRQAAALSGDEMKELNLLTKDIVSVLDRFAEERRYSQSRMNSRPVTPASSRPGTPGPSRPSSPSLHGNLRLALPNRSLPWSGYSTPMGATTPYIHSTYNSRPVTPSGLGPSRQNHFFP